MPTIPVKDATGATVSVGAYADSGGFLTAGVTPLVSGAPVTLANPLAVRQSGPLLTDALTVTAIVAAATAVSVIASNANRKTLCLVNSGAGDAFFGFANTVTAATGWPLYANGGGFTWGLGEAPAGAIYVFSTAGTSIVAKEGT